MTRFLVGLLVVALSGCLERKEDIEIAADGSVWVKHTLKGNPEEFRPGRADALPASGPWDVRDRDVAHEDGKGSDHVREATARFERAGDVSETFGAADDRAPLRMRTSLAVVGTGAAARYTFVRRYEPRAYAWRERAFRAAFPDDLRREIDGLDGKPMSDALKRRAAGALLAFERVKTLGLLEQAMAAAEPERVGDVAATLQARAALGRAFDAAWTADAVLAWLDLPADRKAELDDRYRTETAIDAARAAAGALGRQDSENGLLHAFTVAQRVLEATEDLQDESFEVRVTFPVPVVAADAAEIADGGRTAVFRFRGEDLRDAPLVLRAVAGDER